MRWKAPVVGAAIGLFVVGGLLSAFRYVDNYSLYRGFPAPRDPKFVSVPTPRAPERMVRVRSGSIVTIFAPFERAFSM